MFHAHRYARNGWPGEPEIDPTMDYEEREQIEGWEMTPSECLDLAYGGVLREKFVQAGVFLLSLGIQLVPIMLQGQARRASSTSTQHLVSCAQRSK